MYCGVVLNLNKKDTPKGVGTFFRLSAWKPSLDRWNAKTGVGGGGVCQKMECVMFLHQDTLGDGGCDDLD